VEIHQILAAHLARYPQIQMADLYKLLHQAALGSEHAVSVEQEARKWLDRELAEMEAGSDDPLLDPISPDRQILRVHLRPYIHAGKDPEILLCAFIRTANEWHGSLKKLRDYGTTAMQMMKQFAGQFSPEEIETYFEKMESQGFPAMHHSEVYKRLYRPAYRVVARQYLEDK
jgi:hypothetical protein